MNDVFLTSEIVVTGRLVDASNATLFGHLKDDENFKIIYKQKNFKIWKKIPILF